MLLVVLAAQPLQHNLLSSTVVDDQLLAAVPMAAPVAAVATSVVLVDWAVAVLVWVLVLVAGALLRAWALQQQAEVHYLGCSCQPAAHQLLLRLLLAAD